MSALAATLAAGAVLCFCVPAWVYVGYPALLLLLRAAGRDRPVRPGAPPTRVTVILPAHDEQRVIAAKIANVRGADGGSDAQIVVASDGSSDRTVELAREAGAGTDLVVLDLPRVGKARALDAAVAASTGDVLVFSDANAFWEPSSLRALLAPLGDPAVGGVAGVQLYRGAKAAAASTGEGESAYWRWDTWLKEQESALGSAYGADGSLYAIRRELYVPLEDPAQADDMAISMRVVTQGRRLVLAPGAVAWEDAPADPSRELARKIRVTNHSLRSLLLLGPALWTSGWYSVVLVSHKLLRHLTPLFLVAGLGFSAAAAPGSSLARALLLPQAAVYGAALLGWALHRTPAGRFKPLLIPYYFCLANAAALVGSVRALRGRRITSWTHDRKDAPG